VLPLVTRQTRVEPHDLNCLCSSFVQSILEISAKGITRDYVIVRIAYALKLLTLSSSL